MDLEEDTYNIIFQALKHPIRRRILRELDSQPATFTELLNSLGIDNGLLNYHLNNLKELITKGEGEKYSLSEFGIATLSLTRKVEDPLNSKKDTFLGVSPLLVKSIMVILVVSIGVLGFLYTGLDNRYNILATQYEEIKANQIEEQKRLESEILYETLKIALVEEKIPDHNMLTQNINPIRLAFNVSTVVLSNELIEGVDVPSWIGRYKILLLSPAEIEASLKC